MKNLFGEEELAFIRAAKGKAKPKVNPLIAHFGKGPAETKCVTCTHQFFKRFANTYSKCALRGNSGGPATDHNSRYESCGKYEPKPDVNGPTA